MFAQIKARFINLPKILKIVLGFIAVVAIYFLWLYGYHYYHLDKGDIYINGKYISQVEYLKRIQDSLPKDYSNVPTRITPEQTWAKLREALKAGDLDLAVEQFVEDETEQYKTFLNELRKNKQIDQFTQDMTNITLSDFNRRLNQNTENTTELLYDYLTKDGSKSSISFKKGENGDWKIKF